MKTLPFLCAAAVVLTASCSPFSKDELAADFRRNRPAYELAITEAPNQKPERIAPDAYKETYFYLFGSETNNPAGVTMILRNTAQNRILFVTSASSFGGESRDCGILYESSGNSIAYTYGDFEEQTIPVRVGKREDLDETWTLEHIEGNWYAYEHILNPK